MQALTAHLRAFACLCAAFLLSTGARAAIDLPFEKFELDKDRKSVV